MANVAPAMLSKEARQEKISRALAQVGALASRAEMQEKAEKVSKLPTGWV